MSKDHLPSQIDPFRFADTEARLHGHFLIQHMSRLCSSLSSHEGEIEVVAAFGVDEQGLRFLKGHLKTELILQCQRCMQPFNYEIMSDFVLGIVQAEEEVSTLPMHYDPLIVKNMNFSLQDMVEDELIVSLPIIPFHAPEACQVKLPLVAESLDAKQIEKDNPFKVIESLRENRDVNK